MPENPSAFPMQGQRHPDPTRADWWHEPSSGMTLRDWFAGMALSGMISHPESIAATDAKIANSLAVEAYRCADALLVERENEPALSSADDAESDKDTEIG